MPTLPGDKVRLACEGYERRRAIVVEPPETFLSEYGSVFVELDDSSRLQVSPADYTNLSQRARASHQRDRVRKPGVRNPRGAGRNPDPEETKTRMVSIRVNKRTWRRLGELLGQQENRSQVVNMLVENYVKALEAVSPERARTE